MPEFEDVTSQIRTTARDAAYVVVGLGVLAFQKAQVRRQELAKHLADPRTRAEGRLGDLRGELTRQFKAADDTVEQLIGRLETSLQPFEDRLPEQARALVKQAQAQARDVRRQLRHRLLAA